MPAFRSTELDNVAAPVRRPLTEWDGATLPFRPSRPCVIFTLVPLPQDPPKPMRFIDDEDDNDETDSRDETIHGAGGPRPRRRQRPLSDAPTGPAVYHPAARVCVPDRDGYYWSLEPGRAYFAETIGAVTLRERLPVPQRYKTQTCDAAVQVDTWRQCAVAARDAAHDAAGGRRRRALLRFVLDPARESRRELARQAADGVDNGDGEVPDATRGAGGTAAGDDEIALVVSFLERQLRFGHGTTMSQSQLSSQHSGATRERDEILRRAVDDALRFVRPAVAADLRGEILRTL
jgi:hypothetical protein